VRRSRTAAADYKIITDITAFIITNGRSAAAADLMLILSLVLCTQIILMGNLLRRKGARAYRLPNRNRVNKHCSHRETGW